MTVVTVPANQKPIVCYAGMPQALYNEVTHVFPFSGKPTSQGCACGAISVTEASK